MTAPSVFKRCRHEWFSEIRLSVTPSDLIHRLRILVPVPPRLPKRSGASSANNGPLRTEATNFRNASAFKNTNKTGTNQLVRFAIATTACYHQSTSRTAVVGDRLALGPKLTSHHRGKKAPNCCEALLQPPHGWCLDCLHG
jgi:hypothetical protein